MTKKNNSQPVLNEARKANETKSHYFMELLQIVSYLIGHDKQTKVGSKEYTWEPRENTFTPIIKKELDDIRKCTKEGKQYSDQGTVYTAIKGISEDLPDAELHNIFDDKFFYAQAETGIDNRKRFATKEATAIKNKWEKHFDTIPLLKVWYEYLINYTESTYTPIDIPAAESTIDKFAKIYELGLLDYLKEREDFKAMKQRQQAQIIHDIFNIPGSDAEDPYNHMYKLIRQNLYGNSGREKLTDKKKRETINNLRVSGFSIFKTETDSKAK